MAAADSTVWTWGRAKNFRLGRAFVGTDARVPEKVRGFEGVAVEQAACGGGHTAVVLEDNRLFVFGYSQYGQLGLGDRTDMCDPTQVFLIPPSVDSISDGSASAAMVSTPEAAAAVVAGRPLPVAQVCCGRYHTIARTVSGLVFTWGGGKNGRLGHADEKIRAQPACVEALLPHKVRSIMSGYHNNLVLTEADQVWSWGWGAHGQLGLGDTRDRDVPTVINELTGKRIVTLSCGDRHSFAVTDDGRVFGWGSNEFGQLGCGSKGDTILAPRVIVGLDGLIVTAISSGDRHSAAVTNMGSVYTWGCGSDGQCGHGMFRDAARPKLVESLVGKLVIDVKCGHNFTMVLTSSHEVYSWGNNTYGQLGNNGNGRSASPVKVLINSNARVSRMSCAHFHCILWMPVTEPASPSTSSRTTSIAKTSGANDSSSADLGVGNTDDRQTLMDANERLALLIESYAEKRSECRAVVEDERQKQEAALAGIYPTTA